jgi:hypothetical protein
MKTQDDRDIEGFLAACRLKPVPPGLKEKILGSVRKGDNAYLKWKSALKMSLVVCPLILAFFLGLDAVLSRSEQVQIQALMAGPPTLPTDSDEASLSWAEVSGDTLSSELLVGRGVMLVQRKDINAVRRELAAFLKEEFEGYENSKSIN